MTYAATTTVLPRGHAGRLEELQRTARLEPEARRRAVAHGSVGERIVTDEYKTITTTFRRISTTGLAIMVDRPKHQNGRGGWAVIPRSLLHGGDDLKVEGFKEGDEVTVRLMAWKAEELGFA